MKVLARGVDGEHRAFAESGPEIIVANFDADIGDIVAVDDLCRAAEAPWHVFNKQVDGVFAARGQSAHLGRVEQDRPIELLGGLIPLCADGVELVADITA